MEDDLTDLGIHHPENGPAQLACWERHTTAAFVVSAVVSSTIARTSSGGSGAQQVFFFFTTVIPGSYSFFVVLG